MGFRRSRSTALAAVPTGGTPLADLVSERHRALHELAFDLDVEPEQEPARWATVSAALSGHLAATELVVHHAARRHLDGGKQSARRLLDSGRAASMAVRGLEQHLRGDAYTGGHSLDFYCERLRRELTELARVERALVAQLQQVLPSEEQAQLAERLDTARRRAASRPHPHSPQSRLLGAAAFRFNRRWDAVLDTLDNRPVPPRPRTAVPIGRWGAYLTGMPAARGRAREDDAG